VISVQLISRTTCVTASAPALARLSPEPQRDVEGPPMRPADERRPPRRTARSDAGSGAILPRPQCVLLVVGPGAVPQLPRHYCDCDGGSRACAPEPVRASNISLSRRESLQEIAGLYSGRFLELTLARDRARTCHAQITRGNGRVSLQTERSSEPARRCQSGRPSPRVSRWTRVPSRASSRVGPRFPRLQHRSTTPINDPLLRSRRPGR